MEVLRAKFSESEFCPYSLMHVLAEIVREGRISELENYKMLHGHLGYTILQYLKNRPKIITMLRDPVRRTISTYKHIRLGHPMPQMRANETHWAHEKFDSVNASLEEFISYEPTRRLITNFQVRNIALEFDLSKKYIDNNGDEIEPRQGKLFSNIDDEIDDEEKLKLAKDRLSEFEFVGVVERFDESIKLLYETFGWGDAPNMPQVNTTPDNLLSVGDVSDAVIDEIKSLTKLDAELYNFATQIFDKRLKNVGL